MRFSILSDDVSLFRVAAGKEKRAYDSLERFPQQKFEIERIHYKTDEYMDSIGNFIADIVIIVLKTPIKFQSHILPICLPFGER